MGHSSDAKAANSAQIRFLVGSEQRGFTIHSDLVAPQSPVLKALVNGTFIEGITNCVTWRSVDEPTFMDFWSYVYKGDYEPPSTPAEKKPTDGKNLSNSIRGWHRLVSNVPSITTNLSRYAIRYYEDIDNTEKIAGDGQSKTTEPQKPVDLVRHARLYVFADCYAIEPLMELTLTKLHRDLMALKLSKETTKNVVALICYSYKTTTPDRLRELVVLYTTCHLEEIWMDVELQQLFHDHVELSKAVHAVVLPALIRRLN